MRCIGLGLALASGAAGQPVIVDIDAQTHCTVGGSGGAVQVDLAAGVYIVTPIGPPEGRFTAWHPWGSGAAGCDPSGAMCTQGWYYVHRAQDESGTVVHRMSGTLWATAEQALGAARPAQMRICTGGTFRFMVGDSLCSDNRGGVSLRIEAHGCPVDLTLDGALDFFDFLQFQNLFAADDRRADFDCSGSLDFFDFLSFQNDFASGCP